MAEENYTLLQRSMRHELLDNINQTAQPLSPMSLLWVQGRNLTQQINTILNDQGFQGINANAISQALNLGNFTQGASTTATNLQTALKNAPQDKHLDQVENEIDQKLFTAVTAIENGMPDVNQALNGNMGALTQQKQEALKKQLQEVINQFAEQRKKELTNYANAVKDYHVGTLDFTSNSALVAYGKAKRSEYTTGKNWLAEKFFDVGNAIVSKATGGALLLTSVEKDQQGNPSAYIHISRGFSYLKLLIGPHRQKHRMAMGKDLAAQIMVGRQNNGHFKDGVTIQNPTIAREVWLHLQVLKLKGQLPDSFKINGYAPTQQDQEEAKRMSKELAHNQLEIQTNHLRPYLPSSETDGTELANTVEMQGLLNEQQKLVVDVITVLIQQPQQPLLGQLLQPNQQQPSRLLLLLEQLTPQQQQGLLGQLTPQQQQQLLTQLNPQLNNVQQPQLLPQLTQLLGQRQLQQPPQAQTLQQLLNQGPLALQNQQQLPQQLPALLDKIASLDYLHKQLTQQQLPPQIPPQMALVLDPFYQTVANAFKELSSQDEDGELSEAQQAFVEELITNKQWHFGGNDDGKQLDKMFEKLSPIQKAECLLAKEVTAENLGTSDNVINVINQLDTHAKDHPEMSTVVDNLKINLYVKHQKALSNDISAFRAWRSLKNATPKAQAKLLVAELLMEQQNQQNNQMELVPIDPLTDQHKTIIHRIMSYNDNGDEGKLPNILSQIPKENVVNVVKAMQTCINDMKNPVKKSWYQSKLRQAIASPSMATEQKAVLLKEVVFFKEQGQLCAFKVQPSKTDNLKLLITAFKNCETEAAKEKLLAQLNENGISNADLANALKTYFADPQNGSRSSRIVNVARLLNVLPQSKIAGIYKELGTGNNASEDLQKGIAHSVRLSKEGKQTIYDQLKGDFGHDPNIGNNQVNQSIGTALKNAIDSWEITTAFKPL